MAFWGKKDDSKPKSPERPLHNPTSSVAPTAAPVTSAHPPKMEVKPDNSTNDLHNKVRSALGPGTVIQGRLSFDSVVSIDGKLGGEIFSSKALYVGRSGVIDAKIEVQSLIVRGVVRGTIKATERIEIREGGQILGDIITPVLVMDDGCVFNGACTMTQAAATATKIIEAGKASQPSHTTKAAETTPKKEAQQIAII